MRLSEMIYTEEEMQELRNEIKNLKLTLEQMENTCKDYLNDRDTLREENRLLKNEIAWLKDHTKYNGITEEYYIDGTMTATEAKLRLQQAEANQNYVSNLEEENRKLNERIRFLEQCLDNKEKVNKSLREELKELNKMMLFETELEK